MIPFYFYIVIYNVNIKYILVSGGNDMSRCAKCIKMLILLSENGKMSSIELAQELQTNVRNGDILFLWCYTKYITKETQNYA